MLGQKQWMLHSLFLLHIPNRGSTEYNLLYRGWCSLGSRIGSWRYNSPSGDMIEATRTVMAMSVTSTLALEVTVLGNLGNRMT